MTITIDIEASREEWDAFLEAVEAETRATETPRSPREAITPPTPGAEDGLVELLSEVRGFHVGALPHR